MAATNPMVRGFQQGGQWVEAVTSGSGSIVSPPLVFTAYDYYGVPLFIGEDTYVSLVQQNCGDVLLSGNLVQYVSGEGAVFSHLVLLGSPTTTCTLHAVFNHEETKFANETDSVNVFLSACKRGEWYNKADKRCIACEEGYIKFTNSTTVCEQCVTGMLCPGYNVYSLLDGYWMAPGVSVCDADDAACVMRGVYECTWQVACKGNYSGERGNVDGSLHVPDDSLCSTGYSHDVVLCDHCDSGFYSIDSSGVCKDCPALWLSWVSVSLLLLGFAVALRVCIWLFYAMRTYYRKNADKTNEHLIHSLKTRGAVNILLGHMQVLLQTATLFASSMPDNFFKFVTCAAFLDLSYIDWLGLSCIYEAMGGEMDSGYYVKFVIFALLPFLVSLPIICKIAIGGVPPNILGT
eukprot:gene23001-27825_t